MKPTFSIVFFTVISGAGLGLLSLLALADLCVTRVLPREMLVPGIATGFSLVAMGLASSTLHLAKPSNAWRAFSRFRTSWLSREAVLAAKLMALTLIYAGLAFTDAPAAIRLPVAALVFLLSCSVLFCTAMIYASLKPIRQWHTRWTPACYVLLGHWSGSLLLLALAIRYGADVRAYAWLAAALGVAALAAKAGYWRAAASQARMLTIERAIGVREGVRPPGVTVAQARLFDAGHSHGTFLTNEFGFVLARRHARALRAAALLLAFAAPGAAWAAGARSAAAVAMFAVVCIIGLMAERWLFFAEARHTVRLYHGDART
ncbi:MAG TPA: DmsC/YnfH family molybdoenzyme membrane anchor subunit [Casimicrobiaceae bacterium]|jgi:DMSO reductase anchor subunit